MKEIVDFDEALQKAKEATGKVTLATGFYPRKRLRGNRPRSESEQIALCRAVCEAVRKSKEDGIVVKTEDGYIINW